MENTPDPILENSKTDLEILNHNAERMNLEAEDVLAYQIDLLKNTDHAKPPAR
jgi:hypothetical protein